MPSLRLAVDLETGEATTGELTRKKEGSTYVPDTSGKEIAKSVIGSLAPVPTPEPPVLVQP